MISVGCTCLTGSRLFKKKQANGLPSLLYPSTNLSLFEKFIAKSQPLQRYFIIIIIITLDGLLVSETIPTPWH